jgi:hypothetical protein
MNEWTSCDWLRFLAGLSPAIAAVLFTAGAAVERWRLGLDR